MCFFGACHVDAGLRRKLYQAGFLTRRRLVNLIYFIPEGKMKIWWTAFYVLLASVVAENATTEAEAQAEAIEQLLLSMPTCGVSCI